MFIYRLKQGFMTWYKFCLIVALNCFCRNIAGFRPRFAEFCYLFSTKEIFGARIDASGSVVAGDTLTLRLNAKQVQTSSHTLPEDIPWQ